MTMPTNRQIHVLIVDPYPEFFARLDEMFSNYFPQSATTTTSTSTTSAYQLLQQQHFDLIIVKNMQKDDSTLSFCGALRQLPNYVKTPLLMLSTQTTTAKRLSGFATGIDDYVVSPIDERLLVSRIRLLCRLHGFSI